MLLAHGSEGHRYTTLRDVASILVIDRRLLTRGCFIEILKSEFSELEIIGLAAARELDEVKGRNMRLVVLNIDGSLVTDPSVLHEIAALKRVFPDTPIAVVADRADDALASEAIQRGVKCYLPTSLPLEVAVAALRLTLVGGVYYPRRIGLDRPAVREAVALGPRSDSGAGRPSETNGDELPPNATGQPDAMQGLTRREVEVLAALQRGRSNKLIACELGMSENTVKVHIQRIMRKLHASNRTEAVLISQRRLSLGTMGFLAPPDRPTCHGPNSASTASGRR